jgi:hypothetical protein
MQKLFFLNNQATYLLKSVLKVNNNKSLLQKYFSLPNKLILSLALFIIWVKERTRMQLNFQRYAKWCENI